MNEKPASYDPVYTHRQMRIAADIIMDEISTHVDKELDRFGDSIQYMKNSMSRHLEKQHELYSFMFDEWIKVRDGKAEKDSR